MERTLERRIGREPSLSTISFDELQRISEQKRKSPFARPKSDYRLGNAVKKAVAVVAAAGAIALGGMHVGAKYSREITQFEDRVMSYFSSTATAGENQNTTYEGGN